MLLHSDKATISQRADRADTILHEMAHMWYVRCVVSY